MAEKSEEIISIIKDRKMSGKKVYGAVRDFLAKDRKRFIEHGDEICEQLVFHRPDVAKRIAKSK